MGILPKSEMSHEDMISILEHLHQYVPTESSTERFKFPQSDETMDISIDRFHHVLFGGDLLTAKRARVGQRIRGNSERGKHRLEGLLPIAEDWHAKLCLLTVSVHTCTQDNKFNMVYRQPSVWQSIGIYPEGGPVTLWVYNVDRVHRQ